MQITDLLGQLPSRAFRPRVYGVGAWTDNLHFAYDLVALTRPGVLVELGVDRGESYFSFCQAVAEECTDTRCFAVDTWQGDAHAGGYDETTFKEVTAENDAHYTAFSTLIRATFDDARARFGDGEIDVLHIDGLHTEEAVRHDVENWLQALKPGGILLMHDVSVHGRGFGVWKVWDELRARGRSWTFAEGPGLGVWQKPPAGELALPLEALLSGPNESNVAVTEYYRQRAAKLQRQMAEHWRDGSIRQTPFAQQTAVQIFLSRDGSHSEEESVFARIGHEGVKELRIVIPPGGCEGGLRIDFGSALTTIEVLAMDLLGQNGDALFAARPEDLHVGGDAVREPTAGLLRVRITGIDPQIYLPPVRVEGTTVLHMKLCVLTGATSDDAAAPADS